MSEILMEKLYHFMLSNKSSNGPEAAIVKNLKNDARIESYLEEELSWKITFQEVRTKLSVWYPEFLIEHHSLQKAILWKWKEPNQFWLVSKVKMSVLQEVTQYIINESRSLQDKINWWRIHRVSMFLSGLTLECPWVLDIFFSQQTTDKRTK